MATLILDRVWINRLDTGEAVSAGSVDRSQQYEQDGEVITFAGGRQRAVATEGERGTFGVTLRRVSLATVGKLRDWMGVAVLVRDHRGQRWTGVFFTVMPSEPPVAPGPTAAYWYDVALTLRTITAAEGV
ncbi:hypothetical protein OOJ91_13685 [Micromonospora lupini]|uniref:hypothetical protein n=1 Tax=Micromonospora lupini TaxID=285679 RepID=UPI002257BD99|nr:hypothetical protein [Micromonospora lupini]MCX5066898.1 hypothetical protein [Micromonospora lupini]